MKFEADVEEPCHEVPVRSKAMKQDIGEDRLWTSITDQAAWRNDHSKCSSTGRQSDT